MNRDADPEAAFIRELEDQARNAVLQQDVGALERLWSEALIVNNPQNQVSSDRKVVMDLVRRGLIRYTRFERRIDAIRMDGDIALVMGAETVEPIGEAPRAGRTVERRFTHVWKKHDTLWRLIARHANVVAPG